MLSEVIRQTLEDKLNSNTLGKVFRVGSYAVLDDTTDDFIFSYKNGYKKIDENFIPAMIRFNAEYKAMPQQITGMATINTKFLVLAEYQDEIETDIAVVEEVVPKVIASSEQLIDGETAYNSVWHMTALTPIGEFVMVNGKRYLQLETTIYISFSNKVYFGNQYEYYLNGTRVYPFIPKGSRNNEENNPHKLGDYEAKGGNSTSVWTGSYTFYVSEFLSKIIDTFASSTYDMDRVFEFMEVTPTNPTGNEFPVRIQSAAYTTDLGEEVVCSLTLMKSDTAYTEPTYTITYTLNGGTNNPSNPATFDEEDLPLTLLDATKTSYIFDGWYETATFTGLPKTQITYGGNITLYAKFTFISVKIWEASSEAYWNLQDVSNRGTDISATPDVSPTLDVDGFALGYAMRVSDGSLPATYYYYVAAMTEE